MKLCYRELEDLISIIKRLKKKLKKHGIKTEGAERLQHIIVAIEGIEDLEEIEDFCVKDHSIEEFDEMIKRAREVRNILRREKYRQMRRQRKDQKKRTDEGSSDM
jgi:uncharacterized protein YerC